MATYKLALLTKKIYISGFKFFTLKSLKDILEIKNEGTFFSVLQKLLKSEILKKLERRKYLLAGAKINNFNLANLLYQPSYVSFESALNFYGILSQFPYEIISATPKKPIQKTINGQAFSYIHLKKSLFWGYEKKDDFLIALPEKALLDQLYLASKGLKAINLEEYDLNLLNLKRLKVYQHQYPKTKQFQKFVKKLP